MEDDDADALDSILSVLRRHGAVEFTGCGFSVRLAPLVGEAPRPERGPFADVEDALARVSDLKGRPIGS